MLDSPWMIAVQLGGVASVLLVGGFLTWLWRRFPPRRRPASPQPVVRYVLTPAPTAPTPTPTQLEQAMPPMRVPVQLHGGPLDGEMLMMTSLRWMGASPQWIDAAVSSERVPASRMLRYAATPDPQVFEYQEEVPV